jgi:hypothetical protein
MINVGIAESILSQGLARALAPSNFKSSDVKFLSIFLKIVQVYILQSSQKERPDELKE